MIDISPICLLPTAKMLDAMKVIEQNEAKIVLVVNEHNELLGTVTDGDIRRALIRNASVDIPLSQVMNANAFKIKNNYTQIEVENIFKIRKVSQLPVVDENNKVLDLLLSRNHFGGQQKKHSVVIMAGGLGSRLGELTAQCPKPMLKVGDKPILEILLENLRHSGFTDISIAVNFKADMIIDYFGDGSRFGLDIKYIKETERLGTAGALSLFKLKNNFPVIVLNADVLTKVDFTQLIDFHKQNKLAASMCVRKFDLQIPYGVVYVEG
jgi:CBS domain-containing protein